MTDLELIKQLKRISVIEDPKFRCLGCGHEHSCSIHGCAIIKAAADRLEELVSKLDTRSADQMFRERGYHLKIMDRDNERAVYENETQRGSFQISLDYSGACRDYAENHQPAHTLGMSYDEMESCLQWKKEQEMNT